MTGPTGGFGVERYLDVRGAHSPSVGPGGDRLAVLMETTGVAQVWGVDGPRTWPEQLTFGDEPVRFVSWSPTREEFAFGVDEGGDGDTAIHTCRPATGTVTDRTASPDATHRWGGWSGDGERFAFVSNRRDAGTFDVYVQERTAAGPDAAERVHGDAGWVSVVDWSPDDRRLLLSGSGGAGDALFALDLADGDYCRLTDPGDARYRSANWGPDGRSVYLATDRGSDTLYVGRLDPDDGSVTVVEDGGDWNVEGVGLDASGRLAFARNVEGYTDLTTGVLTGPDEYRAFPEPDLPDGVYGQMRVGPDAERFALTVSGRTRPPTVYVVDFETGAARPWTRPSTAGIPRESFVAPEVVRYEAADGRSIPALLTVPEGAAAGSTPAIVDLHDGPASQRRPEFLARVQYFLDRGYAVFEPNVRGSTGYGSEYAGLDDGAGRADAVADVVAGVEWLRERRPVDPGGVVAHGFSYGGFAALAAAVEAPELWAGCVGVAGVYDLASFLENTAAWRREAREREYGSLDDDRELLDSLSPIHRVERLDCPVLVVHGENDPVVPVEQARTLAERAGDAGVAVETLVFEDEGHGLARRENRVRAYREIAAFLASVLG